MSYPKTKRLERKGKKSYSAHNRVYTAHEPPSCTSLFHWLENIFISLTEILKRLVFVKIKLKSMAELNSRNVLPERNKDNSKLVS